MSQTHWKKLSNPDYLGAYSLEPGKDLILTIKSVKVEQVTGPDNRKEECTVLHFVEGAKPMIVNATNAKIITKLYKTPYIEEWEGKKIQVYSTEVKAFGDVVEALRIRPKVPTQTQTAPVKLNCSDCPDEIAGIGGKTAEQIAQYTLTKYGRSLCSSCATKASQVTKGEES
jgi:Zn finger protein HypA/HybF involved in hydrogenase expression